MTRFYLIRKKVSDLKLGDMYYSWFSHWRDPDIKSRRILDIKEKHGHLQVVLPDGKYIMHPDMLVYVEVIA